MSTLIHGAMEYMDIYMNNEIELYVVVVLFCIVLSLFAFPVQSTSLRFLSKGWLILDSD